MKRVLPEFITKQGNNFQRKKYEYEQKEKLIIYLKTRGELCSVAGYVDDLVTGEEVNIPNGGYRDDQYEWSTQEIYHIEKYDAAVVDEFLQYMLKKMAS